MSDSLFRRLEKYRTGGTRDQMQLAIPIPKSGSGKIHRACPVNSCVPGLFQLGNAPEGRAVNEANAALVRRRANTRGTTCPYCGTDADDQDFTFAGDIEAAKKQVMWAAREDAIDAFRDVFKGLGQQFRSGPVRFEVSSNRSYSPPPIFRRPDLLRDLTCDICLRSYGVYAAALFCPDCGARNIHVHFRREVQLISQQVEIARKVGEDGDRELAYRLLGNAHEDVLTAFEAYHKVIYRFLVQKRLPAQAEELCSKRAIGNRFQNIHRGRELYARFSFDPYEGLSTADLEFLRLNIEKRHVLGHNLGMIDEAFAELAQGGKVGETVPILADEVARFATICESVVVGLEERNAEFLPPAKAGENDSRESAEAGMADDTANR